MPNAGVVLYSARMMTEADLLKAIETHCQRVGESEAAFGRRVARDPNLVMDIRQGRSPRLRLVNQIIEAMDTAQA